MRTPSSIVLTAVVSLAAIAAPLAAQVVDEVPQELRSQHQLLADLQNRYGLLLAHFPPPRAPRRRDDQKEPPQSLR